MNWFCNPCCNLVHTQADFMHHPVGDFFLFTAEIEPKLNEILLDYEAV